MLVQNQLSTEIKFRIDISQHHISVGNCRFCAAAVKAGWPGHGTGAAGADLQAVAQQLVEPRNRASARADGERLDHGDADHPPIDDGAEVVTANAVFDHQPDVKARAAHISHHHIVNAQRLRDVVRAHQSGNWTAVERAAGSGFEDLRDSS